MDIASIFLVLHASPVQKSLILYLQSMELREHFQFCRWSCIYENIIYCSNTSLSCRNSSHRLDCWCIFIYYTCCVLMIIFRTSLYNALTSTLHKLHLKPVIPFPSAFGKAPLLCLFWRLRTAFGHSVSTNLMGFEPNTKSWQKFLVSSLSHNFPFWSSVLSYASLYFSHWSE